MYPLDVIAHVVNTAEDSVAAVPFTHNAWVVLCFMSGEVLLAGESTPGGLRASWRAAEE
jgi:hypothetical protein